MIERQNLFPEALSKRVVGGHVLYSPVVTVVAGKLVFVSGLLARNQAGEIVGKGDMGAQIRQVGENLKAAMAAAGATLADLVRTQAFTTDIDEFFKHVGVRMEYFAALPTSTTREVEAKQVLPGERPIVKPRDVLFPHLAERKAPHDVGHDLQRPAATGA